MASTHKHLRSSTANKRPTTSIADGQIALNTNSTSPGLFFKDSTGATVIKIGPVHVGTTAPNATPASGGSSGNSTGEIWLDTSLTPNGVKIWNGSAWVNATPVGSTTVQGLLELATSAETQTGTDTDRAVTPAGLQSKLSDSTSTTSSTTIASSTAVKAAYDLANAALPKSGGTMTGALEIGTTGSLVFEGSTADAFETTIAVTDPTLDRTITLPDQTGTVIVSGNASIVDADISASAEIAVSKLADGSARQLLQTDAAGTGVEWTSNVDIPGTLDVTGATTLDSTLSFPLGSAGSPSLYPGSDANTGIYSPGADQVAVSTNGVERVEWGTSEVVFNDGGVDYDFRIEGDTNANLFFVDASTDRVGIGTNAPVAPFQLSVSSGEAVARIENTGTASAWVTLSPGASGAAYLHNVGNTSTIFTTNSSERARIDSSGRLLVGTSSDSGNARVIAAGNTSVPTGTGVLAVKLATTRPTTANQEIGVIRFESTSNTLNNYHYASIFCYTDGASGADNDIPGRLVFATTADAQGTPTERMRIESNGRVGIGTAGAAGFLLHVNETANATAYGLGVGNASFATTASYINANRAANSAYSFLGCDSGNAVDREFTLRGDGTGLCDGTWTGGGADYAEYFEWSDSNPAAEDRRGISVVLDGDKIREALPGEDPIGVISGNPSVVGDAAWNKWTGKYLRDEYGTYIQEDYEVEDEDGNTVIQQRRKLNPAFDPDVEYISRENRPEWDCVGLMGKLRIRKGQATGSRWIKMRDINDSVEEWLVR